MTQSSEGKHFFLTTAIAFVLMLMETALGRQIEWGFVRMDGVASLVVWCSLAVSFPFGLFWIFTISFIAEAFSSVTAGLYTLSFVLSYFFIQYTLSNIIISYVFQKMLLVAFTSLLTTTILLAAEGLADMIWPWAVMQAFFSGLASICFFYIFDRIFAKFSCDSNLNL